MNAKKSIHFSGRNMLIKMNAQNVILPDGERTTIKVKISLEGLKVFHNKTKVAAIVYVKRYS